LGLAYFAALAVWFAVIGVPNRAARLWHLMPVVLSAAGLSASIYLVGIMRLRIEAWCTWCLGVHLINAALGLLTFLALPRGPDSSPARPRPVRARAAAVSSVAVAIIAMLAAIAYSEQRSSRYFQHEYARLLNNPDFILWQASQQPRVDVALRPDDFAIGQ